MSFDWNDYFTLAQELAQNKTNEAKMRSAISRGYYCAHNLAKDYLKSIGRNIRNVTHEELWNQFTSIDVSIQSWGDRTRKIRNQADYDSNIKNLHTDARTAMMYVQQIINELKKDIPEVKK